MSLLNLPSDGLPSVLFTLIRSLYKFGPMPEDQLLALCCPATLKAHTEKAEERSFGRKTINRWKQIGIFLTKSDRVELAFELEGLTIEGFEGVRAIGKVLRDKIFESDQKGEQGLGEGYPAEDFTWALSWALAQDVFGLPGGAFNKIEAIEANQFEAFELYAFQNDTRWNGFKLWVPILGFGWTEVISGNNVLVIDATQAVEDALMQLFVTQKELPIEDALTYLSNKIPVLDGGQRRKEVEVKLDRTKWMETRPDQISISLSAALKALEATDQIALDVRADALQKTLLGQNYREIGRVSHIRDRRGQHA